MKPGVIGRWAAPSYSFGHRIADTGGYTSGFDYLRLVLALSVIVYHSMSVTNDPHAAAIFPFDSQRLFIRTILPMFFALSGFLVAASLVRTPTLKAFMGLRLLRLLPALMVEITLSALIIGPLFTSLSIQDYVLHPNFRTYFLNVVGWVHFKLPDVFLGNPIPLVMNASLWTVPYEAECYFVLAVLSLAGIKLWPRLFFLVLMLGCIALTLYALVAGAGHLGLGSPAAGRQLVLFFLAGVCLYLIRDLVPWSRTTAVIAAVTSLVLLNYPASSYLAPVPVAYITAYLGLLQPKKLPVIFGGDYSYGLYLYAYPMQQATIALFATYTWYSNVLIALFFTSLFAAFSWHTIEKPALRLKKHLLASGKKPIVRGVESAIPSRAAQGS